VEHYHIFPCLPHAAINGMHGHVARKRARNFGAVIVSIKKGKASPYHKPQVLGDEYVVRQILGKVVSVLLTENDAMKAYWGSVYIAPHIL